MYFYFISDRYVVSQYLSDLFISIIGSNQLLKNT